MWPNSRKVIIFENRRNCSPSELHGGGLFRTFNSYSFNFNGGLHKRRTGYCLLRTPSPRGKQFLWFLKIDLLRFHRILSPLWLKYTFVSLDVLIKDQIYLNLCPNMNQFDAVGFSECHSEEVISFFWRSVYYLSLSNSAISVLYISFCLFFISNLGTQHFFVKYDVG